MLKTDVNIGVILTAKEPVPNEVMKAISNSQPMLSEIHALNRFRPVVNSRSSSPPLYVTMELLDEISKQSYLYPFFKITIKTIFYFSYTCKGAKYSK